MFKTVFMGISCKQAVDIISKKEEGKVSLLQRIQLYQHLLICYLCKRFNKQNDIIINAASKINTLPTAKLNPEDKSAIIQVMEETH